MVGGAGVQINEIFEYLEKHFTRLHLTNVFQVMVDS